MSDHPRFLLVPASFLGIVLGVIGLGNAWRVAHRIWQLPSAIGETLEWLTIGTLCLLLVGHLAPAAAPVPAATAAVEPSVH